MSRKRERDVPLDERATPVKRFAIGDSEGGKICVVGIDFGTSRTGYAYAYLRNKDEIESKQPGGQGSGKTHSSILLNEDGTFVAFGPKAREKYYENDEKGLFFENYKMVLDEGLDAAPQATALNGRKLPLLTVIAETLRFVRKEAMEEINKSQLGSEIGVADVQWVVTVPAIWKDKAKGLMREAAFQAGMISSLASDNLQLALEPEAACMACENDSKRMKVGESFMVLDCGGGTVDITTYQVENTNPWTVKELAVPSGGPWGSTFVDAQFEAFVKDFIGAEAFRKFKPSCAWVELMETWETVKLGCNEVDSFDEDLTKAINFSPLLDVLEGNTIPGLVAAYNTRHGTKLEAHRKTTVKVPLSKILNFFRPVVDKIVKHVKDLLSVTPVDYILLVGGFAESKLLLHRVKNEFEQGRTQVVVPLRPSLAVVRGAVAFCLGEGKQIQSRLARYTYGYNLAVPFDPLQRHHLHRPIIYGTMDGKRLKNIAVFEELVRGGTRVHEGFEASKYFSVFDDETQATIKLFVSPRPDVKFVDEEGVKELGSVTVPMVKGQGGKASIGFGSTEIKVTAENEDTGVKTRTAINYKFSAC